MKKEIIRIDNLSRYSFKANYIYDMLLRAEEVLSVRICVSKGQVDVYHKGDGKREDYVQILTKKGFPEKGTTTRYHKIRAFYSCIKGAFV